jgi:hypothetical protein
MMTRRRSIDVFVESMIRTGKAHKISVDKTEEKGLILGVEIILNWVLLTYLLHAAESFLRS